MLFYGDWGVTQRCLILGGWVQRCGGVGVEVEAMHIGSVRGRKNMTRGKDESLPSTVARANSCDAKTHHRKPCPGGDLWEHLMLMAAPDA